MDLMAVIEEHKREHDHRYRKRRSANRKPCQVCHTLPKDSQRCAAKTCIYRQCKAIGRQNGADHDFQGRFSRHMFLFHFFSP